MVTKQGIIKRISLNAYNTARKAGLNPLDLTRVTSLHSWVRLTDGNQRVVVATKNSLAIRFEGSRCSSMDEPGKNVKAISLREGDCVVVCALLQMTTLFLLRQKQALAEFQM